MRLYSGQNAFLWSFQRKKCCLNSLLSLPETKWGGWTWAAIVGHGRSRCWQTVAATLVKSSHLRAPGQSGELPVTLADNEGVIFCLTYGTVRVSVLLIFLFLLCSIRLNWSLVKVIVFTHIKIKPNSPRRVAQLVLTSPSHWNRHLSVQTFYFLYFILIWSDFFLQEAVITCMIYLLSKGTAWLLFIRLCVRFWDSSVNQTDVVLDLTGLTVPHRRWASIREPHRYGAGE